MWHCEHGLSDVSSIACAGQFAGKQRCGHPVEVDLSRSPGIVDLEVLGGRKQEPGRLAPSFRSEGDPGSEHLNLCPLMVAQGTSFRTSSEFQCRLKGAGLSFGFGGGEHSISSMLRIDREFGRSF
jgi:hypothetical protein